MMNWKSAMVVVVLAGCSSAADDPGTPDIPPAGAAQVDSVAVDSADVAAGEDVITPEGWGPLRIGMSREEVVAAVGDRTTPRSAEAQPEECENFRPAHAPEGLLVMIESGRLTRLTLVDGSELRTVHGFGVGDEASAIRAALGDSALVTPHKYVDAPAQYLTVWATPPDSAEPRGIVYEIGADGRVGQIHAGGPSIQYVEGCL